MGKQADFEKMMVPPSHYDQQKIKKGLKHSFYEAYQVKCEVKTAYWKCVVKCFIGTELGLYWYDVESSAMKKHKSISGISIEDIALQ